MKARAAAAAAAAAKSKEEEEVEELKQGNNLKNKNVKESNRWSL